MRNLIIALLMALPLSATAQGIIRHDTPKTADDQKAGGQTGCQTGP